MNNDEYRRVVAGPLNECQWYVHAETNSLDVVCVTSQGNDREKAERIAVAWNSHDDLVKALEDAMLILQRIKGNAGILDNAGYTPDGRMLVMRNVESQAFAALAAASTPAQQKE